MQPMPSQWFSSASAAAIAPDYAPQAEFSWYADNFWQSGRIRGRIFI
jgi:hypothetical protein